MKSESMDKNRDASNKVISISCHRRNKQVVQLICFVHVPVGFPSISTSPMSNCPENTMQLTHIIKDAV